MCGYDERVLLFQDYFQAITFTSNIISTSGGHQGLSQSRGANTKILSTVCCTCHWQYALWETRSKAVRHEALMFTERQGIQFRPYYFNFYYSFILASMHNWVCKC